MNRFCSVLASGSLYAFLQCNSANPWRNKQTNKQTIEQFTADKFVCFFHVLFFKPFAYKYSLEINFYIWKKSNQTIKNYLSRCLLFWFCFRILELISKLFLSYNVWCFLFLPLDNALQCSRCAEIVIKMKTVIHVLMRKGSININGADEGGGFNFDANYWKELLFIRLSCQIRKWIMLQMNNFLGCSFLLKVNFMLSVQHLIRGRASLLTQFVKIQLNGH